MNVTFNFENREDLLRFIRQVEIWEQAYSIARLKNINHDDFSFSCFCDVLRHVRSLVGCAQACSVNFSMRVSI